MNRELLKRTLFNEYIDRLVHLNKPILFNLQAREDLSDEFKVMATQPRGKLQKILNKLREFNGTFGDLIKAFEALRIDYVEEEETQEAMKNLLDGVNTIMQEAKELSKKQAQKQYSDKKTVERDGIEPIQGGFPYVLFSVTHFL